MKRVLCVRHQASAHLGVLAGLLERAGVAFDYFDPWQARARPALGGYSGVLVLGGEMNVDRLDRYPWLEAVRDTVRDALARDMPLLGICLGAQTIARVLHADVYASPVKEVGFHPLAHTPAGSADPVVAPFEGVPVFQWHEDAFQLPDGATLLCAGTDVAHQAFRVGERTYGMQFHFEVDEAIIERWCDETERLHEDWGVTKEALLAEANHRLPAQRAAAGESIARFSELVVG